MGGKERMRLIDADALKLDIMCVYGSNPQYINWLNHAPTVDAVPVVRCKDCARGATCFTYRETGDGDGFCKWAERRSKTP